MHPIDYSKYSLQDLCESRDQIDRDKYPEDYARILEAIAAKERSGEKLPKNPRPKGISILSVLYIIGAVIAVIVLLFQPQANLDKIDYKGVTPTSIYLTMGFLLAFVLLTTAGMWFGKKWGWWLGSFIVLFSITKNVYAITMIPSVAEHYRLVPTDVAELYIKHIGRVIIQPLILLYYFRESVVNYFSVGSINPWVRFLILIGMVFVAYFMLALVYVLGRA